MAEAVNVARRFSVAYLVLAALPVTPAGVGVVEAFLIPSLVGFGVPRGSAILGVLAWRALSFLAPIPIGLAAYLSLSDPSVLRDAAAVSAARARLADVEREIEAAMRRWEELELMVSEAETQR